jgi:hypothetical protein
MEKRKQLQEILHRWWIDEIEEDEAINSILLLFDVSGNEANQSSDKKDGEVAGAFAEWIAEKKYWQDMTISYVWYNRYINEVAKNTEQLFEIFIGKRQ